MTTRSRAPAAPLAGEALCARERPTQPCGEYGSCRQAKAADCAAPPGSRGGLRVSDDTRGGFAVPRQLAGRTIRRR